MRLPGFFVDFGRKTVVTVTVTVTAALKLIPVLGENVMSAGLQQSNSLISEMIAEELDKLDFVVSVQNKHAINRIANKVFANLGVYSETVGGLHREYMVVYEEVVRQVRERRKVVISADMILAALN